MDTGSQQATGATPSKVFLPSALNGYPWISPFAVETYLTLLPDSEIVAHVGSLNVGWVRMGVRISWRKLQPNPNDPIRWDLLTSLESELRTLKAAGVTPVLIVYDSPHWAVDANARSDGRLSSCAPIRADRLDEFAGFVAGLARRYKTPEFNIHNWEIGNEPDVEPDWVDPDNGFGCWGDDADPEYFGGKQYGEMLKVVTPAIRAEDPNAQVWLGGLLLPAPRHAALQAAQKADPRLATLTGSRLPVPLEYQMKGIQAVYSDEVKPELFLKGVLEAGAAPYFDILAYHWYPSYYPLKVDFDQKSGQGWDVLGGGVAGKAKFLRDLMKDYGVDKPLFLNESGLGCIYDSPDHFPWCADPDELFYQAQADFLTRSFVRGLGQGITGVSWYTLENDGWRELGLLDDSMKPRPAYRAYQQLVFQLQGVTLLGPVDAYGDGIEAYAFQKGSRQVQVLWALEDQTYPVKIPQSRFVDARSRDGALLMPVFTETEVQLSVGFSPIFLTLNP